MQINKKYYRTSWMEDTIIKIIDQNHLPHKLKIICLKDTNQVVRAIKTMQIRGAGAIGAVAAYALAQACLLFQGDNLNKFKKYIKENKDVLKSTRPTAHDLEHALESVYKKIRNLKNVHKIKSVACQEAEKYADWSANNCKLIGKNGEMLIKNKSNILTHCNAGWLAFVDYGTALAPIFEAKNKGKKVFVFVDETRPRLQGAKLTAFELAEMSIPHTIIVDNAAGFFMQRGDIDLVIVGADRIAANGDTANKIGTYEKAVLAKENNIPFYIAAPSSTIDLKIKSEKEIPIEYRDEKEVLKINNKNLATMKSSAKNPAFDITPAKYITGIITEKGLIKANKKEINKIISHKH